MVDETFGLELNCGIIINVTYNYFALQKHGVNTI